LPYFKANRAVFGRWFAYKYSLYLSQSTALVVDGNATVGI
jgi:hypothetical protein